MGMKRYMPHPKPKTIGRRKTKGKVGSRAYGFGKNTVGRKMRKARKWAAAQLRGTY